MNPEPSKGRGVVTSQVCREGFVRGLRRRRERSHYRQRRRKRDELSNLLPDRLHRIVQYPTNIELMPEREQWMVDEAVAFVNATYGGRAVFAARLDRDESGGHTVDVFASPIFRKETRRGSQDWVSTTRHGKELCKRHRAEIERRHGGRFLDGPRQVGIALQFEWRAHLLAAARDAGLDLDLEPKREKQDRLPDRLDPEQFKDVQDARRQADEIVRQARRRGETYTVALDGIRSGRLLPSPRPGEWIHRERISQRRISARADRLLDRTSWTPDEWGELCRVSEKNGTTTTLQKPDGSTTDCFYTIIATAIAG